jgi:hypothetical protein
MPATVTGNPFPSKDFKFQVADIPVAPALPTWKDVGLLTSWTADANDELGETDVFGSPDPVTNVGRERATFQVQGLLADSTDTGQALIAAHIAAKDYFLIQCLWDGVNGWTAKVRYATRNKSGRAGNTFAETQWNFSLLPSTITLVGLGPVF